MLWARSCDPGAICDLWRVLRRLQMPRQPQDLMREKARRAVKHLTTTHSQGLESSCSSSARLLLLLLWVPGWRTSWAKGGSLRRAWMLQAGLAASVRVAQDSSACVFVCAELPLVAAGPGMALRLPISLAPSYSPRWVPLGQGLGAGCPVPTDTRLRATSLVLIWRRQEGEELCVFFRARGELGRMCIVHCMWEGWQGFLVPRSTGGTVP